MGRADFIVSVGADDQEVLSFRPTRELLENFRSCCINPLKVIKEKNQRVFLSGEYAEKPSENRLEPSPRFLSRERRDRRLRADDEFELGDQVYDQLPVWFDGFPDRVSPMLKLLLALSQDLMDKSLEHLAQCAVRDVSLLLIKFPRDEYAARENERFLQLLDYRGLANAGITGYKRQFGPAACDDALEHVEQRFDLSVTTVQPLRDPEPLRRVMRAKEERIDASARLPVREALIQVGFDPSSRLIAFLGGLGQELHN